MTALLAIGLAATTATPSVGLPDATWVRHAAPVALSVLVPGAGQAFQSRWTPGLAQGGATAICVLVMLYSQQQTSLETGLAGSDRNVGDAAAMALVGVSAWSAVDALLYELRPAPPPSAAGGR